MLERNSEMEAATKKKGVRERAAHRSAEFFQELREQVRQKQCSQTAEDCLLALRRQACGRRKRGPPSFIADQLSLQIKLLTTTERDMNGKVPWPCGLVTSEFEGVLLKAR